MGRTRSQSHGQRHVEDTRLIPEGRPLRAAQNSIPWSSPLSREPRLRFGVLAVFCERLPDGMLPTWSKRASLKVLDEGRPLWTSSFSWFMVFVRLRRWWCGEGFQAGRSVVSRLR